MSENSNNTSALTSIATTMQSWAEICSRYAKKEPTLELQWYLKGRAEAHAMDAERARSLADPRATVKPMEGDPVTESYKAALKMLTEFARVGNEEEGDG